MNNYDTSSTGVNLDLVCFYDTGLSYHYFQENFKRIEKCYTYLTTATYIYTAYGNLPSNWCPEWKLVESVEHTFYEMALHRAGFYTDSVLNDTQKETVDAIVADLKHEIGKDNEQGLLDLVTTEIFHGFDDLAYLIESLNFTTQEARGYSQGDYIEVIVPDCLREIFGMCDDAEILTSEYLANLTFDSPIHCRLEVDDAEYYADYFLEDMYEYDKYKIVKGFMKDIADHPKAEYIRTWLEDNLPEHPDYK